VVSSTASIQTTYIQFNLSSTPAGYTGANVAKATLKLFACCVNSTAIGANAVVSENNALVLGCVNGVNNCPAPVSTGPVNFASGQTFPGSGSISGVTGYAPGANSYGVEGWAKDGTGIGVWGVATGPSGVGVNAQSSSSYALYADGALGIYGHGDSIAGDFDGWVNVNGTLTASTKLFRIDHPLDPANKYLNHASVESSEMMNIYTGNVVLDEKGEAWVTAELLPSAESRFPLPANVDWRTRTKSLHRSRGRQQPFRDREARRARKFPGK